MCCHLSALLAEGHSLTCSWKPMGQLGKQSLSIGMPMSPSPKDYLPSQHVKIVGFLSKTLESSADFQLFFLHSYNPSLGLDKFLHCEYPKCQPFPMANSHQADHEDLKQDKDLGVDHRQSLVALPGSAWKIAWLGWCLNPRACVTTGTCVRWMLSVPWEPQCLGMRAELLIKHSQRIRSYPCS